MSSPTVPDVPKAQTLSGPSAVTPCRAVIAGIGIFAQWAPFHRCTTVVAIGLFSRHKGQRSTVPLSLPE